MCPLPSTLYETPEPVSGTRMTDPMGMPGGYDAYFVIATGLAKSQFRSKEGNPITRTMIFKPHIPSFTLHSGLQGLNQLQHSRWRDVLKNQDHSKMKLVDMTAGINPDLVAKADKWIRSVVKWNPERLQVIDSVHKAKGRLVITMGPAGTGKTRSSTSPASP